MTTNIFSLHPPSKIIACDSRWSYETANFLYYIDDSGYDKLIYADNIVAVFAGEANIIELFKCWIKEGMKGMMPNPNGISIMAYNLLKDKYFTRNHGFSYPSERSPEVFFSGSGTFDAMRSWSKYKNCIKAIEDACLTDIYTGGEVKYFDILSQEHNISLVQPPLSDLFDLLKEKGFVMRKQIAHLNTVAEPIKTAIHDPEVKKDLYAVMANNAFLNAPAPEAMIEWAEQEIEALHHFFLESKP